MITFLRIKLKIFFTRKFCPVHMCVQKDISFSMMGVYCDLHKRFSGEIPEEIKMTKEDYDNYLYILGPGELRGDLTYRGIKVIKLP